MTANPLPIARLMSRSCDAGLKPVAGARAKSAERTVQYLIVPVASLQQMGKESGQKSGVSLDGTEKP